jgi:protein transport protein SEC61 subunit gamma-like protein
MAKKETSTSFFGRIADRIKNFASNTKRVIRIARRPTAYEVRLIARVSGIGILLVGGVGYLILLLGNLVHNFFLPPTNTSSTTSSSSVIILGIQLIVSNLSFLQVIFKVFTAPDLLHLLAFLVALGI